jgi:hypothetical protein
MRSASCATRAAAPPTGRRSRPSGRPSSIATLVYREGDFLVLKIKPRAGGYLYVDAVDPDGNVVHLLPTPQRKSNAVKAGTEITIGAPPDKASSSDDVFEMAPPLGRQLLVAVFWAQPLFPAPRLLADNADAYFAVLRAAMDRSSKRPESAPSASFRFFDLVAR